MASLQINWHVKIIGEVYIPSIYFFKGASIKIQNFNNFSKKNGNKRREEKKSNIGHKN